MGVKTALEFASLPEAVGEEAVHQARPGDLARASRGVGLSRPAEEKSDYASISKTKTFAPPTTDPDYLFAHLLRNLESACIKARRYGLAPRQARRLPEEERLRVPRKRDEAHPPLGPPLELCEVLRGLFDELYRKEDIYRATGVVLVDLVPGH